MDGLPILLPTKLRPHTARLRVKDEISNQNFNSHLSLRAQILPAITFKVFGAYTFTSVENAVFFPTWTAAQGMAVRKEAKHKRLVVECFFRL